MADPTPTTLIGARESNRSCLAGDAPPDPVALREVFAGVSLATPVAMAQLPGSTDAPFLVAERTGRIVSIPTLESDEAAVTSALQLPVDIDGEGGITALAPHPADGRVFVAYGARTVASALVLRLSAFSPGPDGITLGDERVLLEIPKDNPFHYGGALAFGPDGYLYLSVGDDGDNSDGDLHPIGAQDPATPYGSILRLDVDTVDATRPWSVPPDNPDFDGNGPTASWAIGFRNPWRLSFDRAPPHALWVANVGSHLSEEIGVVAPGENHGWPYCEGPCDPPDPRFVDPLHAYPSAGGAAVIGGFVYRGEAIPELAGKYVFGDYVKQTISALDPALLPAEPLYVQPVRDVPFAISSFAEDNAGELYALSFSGNGVHRIERAPGVATGGPPERLIDTGCFASLDGGEPVPAPGVFDYDVAQRFWSDGAAKRRQLALPDGHVIDTALPDDWRLPIGAVAIKHFYWRERIIETRLFSRHDATRWSGHTYAWEENGQGATLVPPEGAERALDGLVWEYPSRGDCLRCHSEQAGYTLSLESRQLNVDDAAGASQIDALALSGRLDTLAPEKLAPFPAAERLDDASVPLETRAASWLHVNCSSCHRGEGSAGRARWDARFGTPLAERRLCGVRPFEPVGHAPFDAIEALVSPGDHGISTAWLRASSRGTPYAMPPIASRRLDTAGLALLAEWIDALGPTCPPLGDTLPGEVRAADYDRARDLTPGNLGPSAACDRGDDVDLEPTSDGADCSVSLTEPGEWLEYDVHVSEEGLHAFVLHAASGSRPNDRAPTLAIRVDDEVVARGVEVSSLGWGTFGDVVVPDVPLAAGNHVVRITFETGFVNLSGFVVR